MGVAEAMVDSGTSLIMLPSNYYSDFSVFSVAPDCSDIGSQPSVTVHVKRTDGKVGSYTLTAEDYTVRQGDGNCITGVIKGGEGSIMILGDVFVRKYYTAFNFAEGEEAGQLGWALAQQSGVA